MKTDNYLYTHTSQEQIFINKQLKIFIMPSMKSNLAMLSIMSALIGDSELYDGKSRDSDIDFSPAEKPIPKGCQRYYYSSIGICCKSEAIIHFDALKPSSAFKKYKKWCENHL